MPIFSSDEFLTQRVRTMQIIVAALIWGVISFGLFAVFVMEPQPQQQPFLAYVAAAFTVGAVAMRCIVPGLMAANQRRQLAEQAKGAAGDICGDDLLGVYQTSTIIAGALLEGPAFFVLIAYPMTGQTWLLGVVVGLLVLMAVQFPTRDRVETWVKHQLELLELEKRS
jgi:hypothetical protein